MGNNVWIGLPSEFLWRVPSGKATLAGPPFSSPFWCRVYEVFMAFSTPVTISFIYFSLVHYLNNFIEYRQQKMANTEAKHTRGSGKMKPIPFPIAKYRVFNLLVFLHNCFLCGYSVWTFLGVLSSFFKANNLGESLVLDNLLERLFLKICDIENGLFNKSMSRSLHFYGFWFYISKFYEIIDTIIILLKGRKASLLQSYHHAGAIMCMWAGMRFQSPPIWIFVVFNSFVHSMMYFYFALSSISIRMPLSFKKYLTTLQIGQFVIGGSLACLHAFIWYKTSDVAEPCNCIGSPHQAMPLLINVAYLAPLTAFFADFFIKSYSTNNKPKKA